MTGKTGYLIVTLGLVVLVLFACANYVNVSNGGAWVEISLNPQNVFEVRIVSRTVLLRRKGNTDLTALFVPQCQPIQRQEKIIAFDENPKAHWGSVMRKFSIVENPNHFLSDVLIPGSIHISTVQDKIVIPKESKGPVFGQDCFLTPSFERMLNAQFLEAIKLPRTIGPDKSVSYQVKTKRMDTIALSRTNEPVLLCGELSEFAPNPPDLPKGFIPLVHVLASSGNTQLSLADIYPIKTYPPKQELNSLKRSKVKLRQGKLTVVFYGDSITCGGIVMDPNKAFPILVSKELRLRYPSARLQVYTMAQPGTATSTRISKFKTEVLDKHPDLVVIEFVNDYALSPETIDQNFKDVLEALKDRQIEVILCTPHFFYPKYLRLKSWEEVSNHYYIKQIRALSKTYHVGLADIAARWGRLDDEGLRPDLLLTDGLLHINEYANRIYAEEILDCFD